MDPHDTVRPSEKSRLKASLLSEGCSYGPMRGLATPVLQRLEAA